MDDDSIRAIEMTRMETDTPRAARSPLYPKEDRISPAGDILGAQERPSLSYVDQVVSERRFGRLKNCGLRH